MHRLVACATGHRARRMMVEFTLMSWGLTPELSRRSVVQVKQWQAFHCHCFAGTKRSRLERIVRAHLLFPSLIIRPLWVVVLDQALRRGHTSVTVIHGRGEGILRREIHALCASLKYVESYRLGDAGEGGYGVTIVTFRR